MISQDQQRFRQIIEHATQILREQDYKKLSIIDELLFGVMHRIGGVPSEERRFGHHYGVYAKPLGDGTTQFVAFVSYDKYTVEDCSVVGFRGTKEEITSRELLPKLPIVSLQDFLDKIGSDPVEKFFYVLRPQTVTRRSAELRNPSPQ